ncbi:MAG: ribosomal protein S18-alanine N-acetyltransferase, partial [Eubacterium sp.]
MISIEKFNIKYLDDVYKIECACFAHPWSKKDLENQLSLDTSHFLVALENEKAVGYMGLQIFSSEGYVTNVAVLPEYRRRGIAQRLIFAEFENEMDFITLEVRKSNTPAIRLYEKAG